MNEIRNFLNEVTPSLTQIRHYLHQNPEKSHEEFNTADFIFNKLVSFGFNKIYRPTPTSVIVAVGPNQRGSLAFRADIDALPILEQSEHVYKSKFPGVMHACGHDVHTTILLGLALLLKRCEKRLKKSILLIFQHSEEVNPSGALQLIKQDVIKKNDIQFIYGLHVWPKLPLGKIGLRKGSLMGGLDGLIINILSNDISDDQGILGGIDAIRITASFIKQANGLLNGRILTDAQPYTISFGVIEGGKKPNTFAHSVKLEGTLRYLDQEAQILAYNQLQNVIQKITTEFNAEICLSVKPDIRPPLINTSSCIDIVNNAVQRISELESVFIESPLYASEDFGWYLKHVPGAYVLLGSQSSNSNSHLLHSPFFDVDESVITLGILLFYQIIEREALNGLS